MDTLMTTPGGRVLRHLLTLAEMGKVAYRSAAESLCDEAWLDGVRALAQDAEWADNVKPSMPWLIFARTEVPHFRPGGLATSCAVPSPQDALALQQARATARVRARRGLTD